MPSNNHEIPSARVAVKTPHPDSLVEVRVTPPENNFELKVTPGGDVIELRIRPGASLIEVRIGPSPAEDGAETDAYQLPEEAKNVLESNGDEAVDPLDEYLNQNDQEAPQDEPQTDPLDEYLCHNGEEEEPCDSDNLDTLAEDIAALNAGAALASMADTPDTPDDSEAAAHDNPPEQEIGEKTETFENKGPEEADDDFDQPNDGFEQEEAELEDQAETESEEAAALAEEESLVATDFPDNAEEAEPVEETVEGELVEEDESEAANIGPSAREALARLSAAVQDEKAAMMAEEAEVAEPEEEPPSLVVEEGDEAAAEDETPDFIAPSQLPEESTAVMVESYEADELEEYESPLENEEGPEEALPEAEQMELGLVDDEELNVGPIDVENLKVDLESSRLPDQSQPIIRAKPMMKA